MLRWSGASYYERGGARLTSAAKPLNAAAFVAETSKDVGGFGRPRASRRPRIQRSTDPPATQPGRDHPCIRCLRGAEARSSAPGVWRAVAADPEARLPPHAGGAPMQ